MREESSERQWMHEPGIEEDERENEESPWGRNRRTVPEGIGFRRMSNTPKAEPVFTPKAPKRGLKMQKEAPASVYAMKGPKEERPEGRVSAGKDAQSKSREGVPATSVTEATEAPSAGGAIQQRPPVLSDNVQSNYSRKWRKRILHRSGEGGNAVNFTSAQGR